MKRSKSFAGFSHEIRTSTTLPVQSVARPETLRTNVSQLTPSTHVPSLADAAAAAVKPSHVTDGPVGPSVPLDGVAARALFDCADVSANVAASARTSTKTKRPYDLMTSPPQGSSGFLVVPAANQLLTHSLRSRERLRLEEPRFACSRLGATTV